MKSKWLWAAGIIYIIYGAVMAWYLWGLTSADIPAAYEGTPADPTQFMTAETIADIKTYTHWMDWLYFVLLPLPWLIYGVVLYLMIGRYVEQASGLSYYLKLIGISVGLSILVWLVTLPLHGLRHHLAVAFGVSTEGIASWLHDEVISLGIHSVTLTLGVVVIYLFMRHTRHWWLYVWLLAIPFIILLNYIQPLVIDPLYNDFHPLQRPALQEDIQHMARKAHVPIDDISVVNKSTETHALNAYVNGVGGSLHVVIYDTTLHALSEDEILFVLAHEFGHYVKNHLLWRTIGMILSAGIGLALLGLVWPRLIKVLQKWLPLPSATSLMTVPLLLLLFSIFSVAAAPVENAVSRQAEHAADAYAVALTDDPEAGIGFFHEAIPRSLNDLHPPYLIKLMTYSHPTDFERIVYLMGEESENG